MRDRRTWTVRAVALDIDGTITSMDRRLSLEAVEAIREVEHRGVPVILASGNVAPTAQALAKFIGVTGPVVAENGGLLVLGNEVRRLVEIGACRAAADYAKAKLDLKELLSNTARVTEVCFQETVPLETLRRIVRDGGFDVGVESTGFALHIMPRGLDKAVGVRAALDHLGIPMESLLAIGDGRNDRMMIKEAGIGVAVANAVPELTSVADYVCRRPHGAGVVEALSRFVLQPGPRPTRSSPSARRAGRARPRPRQRPGRRRPSAPGAEG